MRKFIAFIMAAGVLLAAEPSAFKAGNVNAPNAYGLTENEKIIRANKTAIEKLEKRVFSLEQENRTLSELVEAMSEERRAHAEAIASIKREQEKIAELIKQISEGEAKNRSIADAIATRQDALEKQVNKALGDQAKNQEKLAKAIENLVTKAQLDKALKNARSDAAKTDAPKPAEKKSETPAKPAENFDKSQPETLLNEAKKLLEERKYDDAYSRLSYLIGKKYKTPETTFYLGTLYYFQENDERALAAFKTSATADDKARYMPVLLYYSGICNERLNKDAEAKKFYETLISLYPDHSVIEGAKKRLEKLSKNYNCLLGGVA